MTLIRLPRRPSASSGLLAMTKVFPFSRYTIHGNSMLPTLKPGQDVLVFNWWRLVGIKVGDIVVVKHNGRDMIKRVSKFLDREKMIYVLGDNKKMSTDSRKFGPIKKEQIIGKVIWYG